MASNPARIQAIGDAVLNKTATTDQLDHLGRALAFAMDQLDFYNTQTQGGKAAYAVERVRKILVGLVRRYDVAMATQAAAATAAQAVDTEFTPDP